MIYCGGTNSILMLGANEKKKIKFNSRRTCFPCGIDIRIRFVMCHGGLNCIVQAYPVVSSLSSGCTTGTADVHEVPSLAP